MAYESVADRVLDLQKKIQERSLSSVKKSNVDAPEAYECNVCHDECVCAVLEGNGERLPVGDSRLFDWSVNPPSVRPHHIETCSCAARRRVNKALKHSHISEEFRKRTFESFDVKDKDERIQKAYRIAKRYAEAFEDRRSEPNNWFGIVGAVGVGKTHLLCAIANELLSRGIFVRYFNFVTGFKEMFAKYDQGGQAVEDIRWELMNCEVLMLDDLAKGKIDKKTKSVSITAPVFNEVYAIVDYRYENNLPIIWSSELYDDLALDGVLGEATATRLFEKSYIADLMYRSGEKAGTLNHRLIDFAE